MALSLRTMSGVAALVVASGALVAVWGPRLLPDSESSASGLATRTARGPQAVELSINDPRTFPGYTLLAPIQSRTTYLIDMQGKVVHTWESQYRPALGTWLLENGHLLRTGALPTGFDSAGSGGSVQEYSWDGEMLWDFRFYNDKQCPHHDLTRLPNGNVLMIVAEQLTAQEALAAGRRTDQGSRPTLLEGLVEVKPTGKTTGEVVWEWHLRDHLVQDHDPSKPNYGNVAEHPELADVNFSAEPPDSMMRTKGGLDKLRSIGYVGNSAARSPNAGSISAHFNSVAYHPGLDQVMVSVRNFSEIWVLDHSTTTAEAAGHTGGRCGRGGDILYRWGNPRAYRAGTRADQRLFSQHDAYWIPPGLPGAGHVLVFNNGSGRPGVAHSSVDEVVPPADAEGRYPRPSAAAFGPDQPCWSYSAPNEQDFYSAQISGAQRLPNGNTLICSGMEGVLLEVTPEKEVVWKCVIPTSWASLFRVQRYGRDYAGLAGRDLTSGKTIEELQSGVPKGK
jgi:Arylsulfotransferase (ASST)